MSDGSRSVLEMSGDLTDATSLSDGCMNSISNKAMMVVDMTCAEVSTS